MKKFTIFFAICMLLGMVLFLFSCKKNSTGIHRPFSNIHGLTYDEFENIDVQLVDYNTVQVTHTAAAYLWSSDICRIDLGTSENGQFIRWIAYSADHDSIYPLYLIHFDFTVKMSEEKIVQTLALRYIKTDSSFVQVQRQVPLYKYPYATANVFFERSDIAEGLFIWDIAVTNDYFFFRPLGGYRIYAYNFKTHNTEKIVTDPIYLYIDANSHYLFYIDGREPHVYRFNLETRLIDKKLLFVNIKRIDGITADENFIYVAVSGNYSMYIKKYTLDFTLSDSIAIEHVEPYFMAVYDSVLYFKDGEFTWDEHGEQLKRFDLKTRSWLPNVWAPCKRIAGFNAQNEEFYYFDQLKWFVGIVPVYSLIPVQSSGEKTGSRLSMKSSQY